MLKETANRWVKALRSGKFKQAKGVLVSSETDEDGPIGLPLGHCCLGVLGEIQGFSREELVGVEVLEDDLQEGCDINSCDGESLNENGDAVKIKLQVKTKNGKTIFKKFENLAQANDYGASFKRIASWIEKNYKSL